MPLERRPGFRELIRRGVIDPRKLPHRLKREVYEDIERRVDELRADRERRRDDELPF